MRLLIVGPLSGQFGAASKIAMQNGAKVAHVDTVESAMHALRSGRGADLAMVDVKLDIAAFVTGLAAEHISLDVIGCGIGNDTEAAVRAIKGGAKEYVPLPPDPELIAAVLKAVADEETDLLYRDQRMEQVIKLADQVAPSNACILVTGESGTGKEVMARHIHLKSRRADKPFVAVNCAAIPDNLLESELFGHEKGAFTGAVARRIGKFEEADGGTLLLDEISEMDIRLQAKLLRAIQEREIDRVGGGKPIKVDIRVIATSNRDLVAEVKSGTFREDLLYRLNVVNLKLPPLRERPEDIAVLADHFVAKYSEANGVACKPIDRDAARLLRGHPWPGNVRELENTLHRAVLLATGNEITSEAIVLPDGSRPGENSAPTAGRVAGQISGGGVISEDDAAQAGLVGRTVAEVEQQLILETLDHCFGNRTHAANILGISIRTLRNKLKAYTEEGVPVPGPGEMRRMAY
ncbi:sigma-54-dependent transcriptional regulator [Minwuia thermotolerans]|uniref:Sigma-54-dependent Fis family transcriptional regulator n=1 Tax=Minwuia thermotolerans TaxID=2056226 RepID=A0A2M9FY98_9PROT|nr:sigma-54 dependent transcriptional regulator [Minwuia thermotolerans]PJK28446.1 sigma-54-dependent Fis family transcriptional regulator [Minwuia thermotolerans]